MTSKSINTKRSLFYIITFFVFFVLYCMLVVYAVTDIRVHARLCIDKLVGGQLFSGNFLVYLVANCMSFFTGNLWLVAASLCIMMAMATTSRVAIVATELRKYSKYEYFWAISTVIVFVIPLVTLFNGGRWYWPNYLVPNVWHNTTTIVLFPFAVWLFILSQKQIAQYDNKRNFYIALLVIINIWIKPSYFFVFVCIYPIFLLISYGLKDKRLYYCLIPLFIGCIFLVVEYMSIYVYKSAYADSPDSSVYISFNDILQPMWLLEKLKYAFVSLIFPISYATVNFKTVKKDRTFWFVWGQVIFAILIFWTCHESGDRSGDGNFYWQIVISVWMLFCYSLKELLHALKYGSIGSYKLKCNKVLICLYLLHIAFGVAYVVRIFNNTYL